MTHKITITVRLSEGIVGDFVNSLPAKVAKIDWEWRIIRILIPILGAIVVGMLLLVLFEAAKYFLK